MASFTENDYSSDDNLVCEERIQYVYLDEEMAPNEEIMIEENENQNENQNFGMIDIEEYERVRDQAEELDGRNWELKLKCKIYELELRILRRTIAERIRDRVRYWKEVATYWKQKTNVWITWMCRQSTEDAPFYPAPLQYQVMLETRYYPHDLNLE